ncbi:MAG: hypothetical protein LBD41_04345 [Clostridiales Family XIII bacterium]|jgi:hypothetical protein|nr:hypothetical protein [Clostridiales Family XIII bacterium]
MTSITYRKNKKTGRTYAYQTESYRDPTTKKVKTRQRYLGVVEPDTGQITSKSKAKPEYDNINLNHIMPNNITDNIRPIVACMAPPALEPALDNEGPIAACMEPSTLSNESPTIDYKVPARLYKNLHTKAYKKIPTIITKSLGPKIVLDKVCEELSLTNLLKLSFPTLYTDILSMVYCIVETGGALENYGIWSDSSEHPANKSYNNEHINYLIENIDIKQIDKFMKAWLRRFIDRKYLCYDLTSLPSYDEIIPLIGKGQTYFTKFKKIYLALLFDQQRNLPVYYYRSHNNIFDFEDIDQINNVFESKGIENTGFILDTEYFMDGKIDKILSNDSTHFTLAVPYRHWLQEIIYKYSHNIYKPASYHVFYEKEHLFSITKVLKWHSTNRKFYLHIYFDKDRTLDEYKLFLNDEILIREFDNAGFFLYFIDFYGRPNGSLANLPTSRSG